MSESFCLEVRGDFACFTRPEMKVERVSYDVITPSAARAVFEAILWKPAINWQIRRIEVLRPIRWASVRRNEVGKVISTDSVVTAMHRGAGDLGLYVEDERQQRAGLFLRDVAYRLHADLALTAQAGEGDHLTKFAEMFRRRAERGQCFNQPYLGCREFAADFAPAHDSGPPPIADSLDLGWMLYDLDYRNPQQPTPLFFRARLEHGCMQVPAAHSPEVRG